MIEESAVYFVRETVLALFRRFGYYFREFFQGIALDIGA